MRLSRVVRPQRTPIFIGCEGQSEMRYAGWLRELVQARKLPFFFELYDLGSGAGDPFARVDKAIDRIDLLERSRERFKGRFLFLDTDQLAADPGRAAQARLLAEKHKFVVIWQDPTHEAFLLRHFPGRDTRQPPDKRTAEMELGRVWGDYRKPCVPGELERRLTLEGARRVAGGLPALADLLRAIALLEG